jgi:S1-C subfamily serine protease
VVDTPPDFPGKGIKSVPRIVMKPTEEARGQPLVGAPAKVTDGFFWVALSAADADISANLALLRERNWIDLPFVYNTGQRAILTFEKGDSGSAALEQAMAAWNGVAAPLKPPPVAAAPSSPNSSNTVFTGTGILVSRVGQVLTNNHVIEDCHREIAVRRIDDTFRPATVIYVDRTNDLALLKMDGPIPPDEIAPIRIYPPVRSGDPIAVYGYPLAGTLSDTGNITGGNISALAGPGDDSRMYQLTAPVQHGNSGGPLLDQSGNVVGIVNAFLSDAQNANFAIKSSVAIDFLDAHRVDYQASAARPPLDLPSIVDLARRFTVQVACQ